MVKTYIIEPTEKAKERIARLERSIPCVTDWNFGTWEYHIECRDYDYQTVQHYIAPIV